MPRWDGKLYRGDSARGGVSRAQSGEHISAVDPAFDDLVAMSARDYIKWHSTYILGCKEFWSNTDLMSDAEALERFRVAIEEMQKNAKPHP